MTHQDALRKIGLLRRVKVESGATEAEVDNARRLAQRLIDRHRLETRDLAGGNRPREGRQSWVYWEHVAEENRLTLNHFGTRGSIRLDGGRTLVLIELRSGSWQVQRASSGGYETVLRGQGLESFRSYISTNAGRTYTFARV